MSEDTTFIEFNAVGNYYGSLSVRLHESEPQWSVENYDGHDWQPIPQYLYEALVRHWTETKGKQ